MSQEKLRIGELAKRTDSRAETIRYYEHEGLLPAPTRTEGNYRLYDGSHVEQLQFIRHCRSLDMTLDEIRSLLGFRDAPAEDWARLILYWTNTSSMSPRASPS